MIYFLVGRTFDGHNPLVVYGPFLDLVQPLVRRHYGGGDGSLGPVLIWGFMMGVLVYSAGLSCISAWLFKGKG